MEYALAIKGFWHLFDNVDFPKKQNFQKKLPAMIINPSRHSKRFVRIKSYLLSFLILDQVTLGLKS